MMSSHAEQGGGTGCLQDRLARYACELSFESLPPEVVHLAKVRVIDTMAALIGGFFGEPCLLARNLAARSPHPDGATVIGTRMKVSAEMAAFANATAARYVEMNDVYHWPGSNGGHPSDVVAPLLAVAEDNRASGRDLVTAVVLGYEVYLRFSDAIADWKFDQANFATLGIAAASARLMRLGADPMAHAIAMAAAGNTILGQVRLGHLSMWKAIAAGHAGRAGVFAAEMARAGIDSPGLSFEGRSGWWNALVHRPVSLAAFGGCDGADYKVKDVLVKQRASCATTISSILAAEKAAPGVRGRIGDIQRVTTEVYERAKVNMGTGEHHWNPGTRETADHSIPYVTAAALLHGTVTPRQFNHSCIHDPELRRLLAKVEVVSNDEFTRDYERLPVLHRTRVTVTMAGGETIVGESGGELGDLSNPMTDAEIEEKFLGLTEEYLGRARARSMLDTLWGLDTLQDMRAIADGFVLA